jgi:polyisoprenyl-teichoic acid--peptidoglycan teichoic acid transferase
MTNTPPPFKRAKPPSRLRQYAVTLLYLLLVVGLIGGIGWYGVQAARAAFEQFSAMQQNNARAAAYAATAAAITPSAPLAMQPTATSEALPATQEVILPPEPTTIIASTVPSDTPPPTNTARPSHTPTAVSTTAVPTTVVISSTPLNAAMLSAPSSTPLNAAANTVSVNNVAVSAQTTPTPTPRRSMLVTNTPQQNTSASTPAAAISEATTPAAPIIVTNTLPPSNTPAATVPTATPLVPMTVAPTATTNPPTLAIMPTVALPTLLAPAAPDPSKVDVTAIPTPVEAVPRNYNLVNIMLLGVDEEIVDDNIIRTDTMIIVSINRDTGTVSMLSLPRDLFVYIPGWSMQRLNLAYGHGEAVGWTDGGFGLLRQTIFYNFGINVHYYALVNLSGFAQIIDTVGGIDLAVDCALEDLPLIGAELPSAVVPSAQEDYYVLPVGYYSMSGREALWYARSRHNSSDFDRGRRQQQLLRALWRAARDRGLIAQAPTLWNETIEVIDTNMPFDQMVSLLPIAAGLSPNNIDTFTLIRTYHTAPWQPPDGQNVQLPLYDTMRPLLEDFYTPPSANQTAVAAPTVLVQNGTANANWDRVAADRLGWVGFAATPNGAADNANYSDTILIDYTGQEKGSAVEQIAQALNIAPQNIRVEPRADRVADYQVIIGSTYNSCTVGGVLAVTAAPPTPAP